MPDELTVTTEHCKDDDGEFYMQHYAIGTAEIEIALQEPDKPILFHDEIGWNTLRDLRALLNHPQIVALMEANDA